MKVNRFDQLSLLPSSTNSWPEYGDGSVMAQ
jgi:hypothetical protein